MVLLFCCRLSQVVLEKRPLNELVVVVVVVVVLVNIKIFYSLTIFLHFFFFYQAHKLNREDAMDLKRCRTQIRDD